MLSDNVKLSPRGELEARNRILSSMGVVIAMDTYMIAFGRPHTLQRPITPAPDVGEIVRKTGKETCELRRGEAQNMKKEELVNSFLSTPCDSKLE